jgi:hypothetical protein
MEEAAVKLKEPTPELLEQITEAHWNGSKDPQVHFRCIHTIDILNHVLSGTVEHDGHSYGFVIRNGDWNGTEVEEWGDADDVRTYEPPKLDPLTLLPIREDITLQKLLIYFQWRDESWFQEQVRKTAYDFHFSPTGTIHKYWGDEAKKRHLAIGRMSELRHWEDKMDAMAVEHDPSLAPVIAARRAKERKDDQ